MNDHLKKTEMDSCGNIAKNAKGHKFKTKTIQQKPNHKQQKSKINQQKHTILQLKILNKYALKISFITKLALEYQTLEPSQLIELNNKMLFMQTIITKLKEKITKT